MKGQRHLLVTILGLTAFCVVTANPHLSDNAMELEERFKAQPVGTFKNLVKSEDFKAGMPDAFGSLGSLPGLATIDYNAPPKEVIKNIGDSVIPAIAAGLALIPGGALIGGVVSAVWGLFSPFFGGEAQKNPMEQMIDAIKDELDNIKNQIKELSEKIPEQMRKEMDAKFSSVIHAAIQGEIRRNEYICNKYAFISKDFSDDIKNHKPINESLRIEMIAYIQDCDNFLKDTTEAFVYPQYADVLWLPSVMTTLVRSAFLTEIANYGRVLQLDPSIISMFWIQIRHDIKMTFKFAGDAAYKRLSSLLGRNNNKRKFTDFEYEACNLQRQLLYFDREMYHYGAPKQFQIYGDENIELNVADFNVTGNDDTHHIQVYYNEDGHQHNANYHTILNCIMGATSVSRVPNKIMSFRVIYVPKKLYQVRVLYFTIQHSKTANLNIHVVSEEVDDPTSDRKVEAMEENGNDLRITIDEGAPNENSAERFLVETGIHKMTCYTCNYLKCVYLSGTECVSNVVADKGTYVIENVIAFKIESDDESKGKIIVEILEDCMLNSIILGVELIVLPFAPE